jgi:hypothetical protein
MSALFACLAGLALVACDRKAGEPPSPAAPIRTPEPVAAPAVAPRAPDGAGLSTRLSRAGAERVVAIGDLHGDLGVTRRALRLAGATDDRDEWVGGALVIVQTGDQIDRDDDDRGVLDLLWKVRDAARKAGGDVIVVNGNHELMNVALDFRYVTKGAFVPFAEFAPKEAPSTGPFASLAERGRVAAFSPGGPYARKLAEQPIMTKVGDTVFVHGGILPKHVVYGLDRMNDETRAWMLGERAEPPSVVVAEDAPVWTRSYAGGGGAEACRDVADALDKLSAKRMVIGHTVQKQGITRDCGDRLWRIDVGMSRYFGGPLELLAIEREVVRVQRAKPGGLRS